jgi:phosphoribosylformylglycinamidine cyclo-ligase
MHLNYQEFELKKTTYKEAGVDIDKGETTLANTKELIQSTFTNGVLSHIGSFGGLFELNTAAYKNPVLVASTDGVGTKLRVAVMAGKHDSVGEDLVNHCVNDIAVLGAKPLFFLDYFATAHLDDNVFKEVITGFSRGCKNTECALIGGETAEMPGIYHGNDYDLCGTIVGIIEKLKIISGELIKTGDILIGIESNGLHTNGYSLARKVLFESFKVDTYVDDLGETVGESLLRIHKNYLPHIQSVINKNRIISGIAHITGGGIIGNTSRLLPSGKSLAIDWSKWERPEIFNLIQKLGNVPEEDMRKTFNLGIGLVMIIPSESIDNVIKDLNRFPEKNWVIGEVV